MIEFWRELAFSKAQKVILAIYGIACLLITLDAYWYEESMILPLTMAAIAGLLVVKGKGV